MVIGEQCSDCKSLDLAHKKLVRNLKSKCKMDVNESILKVVLGGLKDTSTSSEERIIDFFSHV